MGLNTGCVRKKNDCVSYGFRSLPTAGNQLLFMLKAISLLVNQSQDSMGLDKRKTSGQLTISLIFVHFLNIHIKSKDFLSCKGSSSIWWAKNAKNCIFVWFILIIKFDSFQNNRPKLLHQGVSPQCFFQSERRLYL